MESLKEKVMIVNLNISQWGARKYDANATREVEQFHNAHEAGRFNKMLIKSDTMKEIGKAANRARTFHYYNTLPWGDNGDRILSTENYFQYVSEMGKIKNEFDEFVKDFIQEYIGLKEEAKIRLGTLYHEQDYPNIGSIEGKFKFKNHFMPIAETDDFRVNISEDAVKMIKTQITSEMERRVNEAVEEMLTRIREAVLRMTETLSEPGKIFRDSLVGNLQNLSETIPLMNFTNDQRVVDTVKMIKPLIVNPDMLRNNDGFRQEIATKAKQVLNNI
jgi:hypothetical protein